MSASDPPVDTTALRRMLHGWACQMATRFAAPVYLVGSALHKPTPRDIDLSVVLPDTEFTARYGDPYLWDRESYGIAWGEGRQRWARDQVKLVRHLVTGYSLNVDLKIEPLLRAAAIYQDKPRLRLDTVAAIPDIFTAANAAATWVPPWESDLAGAIAKAAQAFLAALLRLESDVSGVPDHWRNAFDARHQLHGLLQKAGYDPIVPPAHPLTALPSACDTSSCQTTTIQR